MYKEKTKQHVLNSINNPSVFAPLPFTSMKALIAHFSGYPNGIKKGFVNLNGHKVTLAYRTS